MKRSPELAEGGHAARAAELLEQLIESSVELRGLALLAPDGSQIVSSDEVDWAPAAGRLWTALDVLGEGSEQVHVATEQGEVFALRGRGGAVLATTDRFALASLVFSDLRALLRTLDGAHA